MSLVSVSLDLSATLNRITNRALDKYDQSKQPIKFVNSLVADLEKVYAFAENLKDKVATNNYDEVKLHTLQHILYVSSEAIHSLPLGDNKWMESILTLEVTNIKTWRNCSFYGFENKDFNANKRFVGIKLYWILNCASTDNFM